MGKMYQDKGLKEKLNDSAIVSSQKNDFKTWMAKYFIEKGHYKLTQKAIKTFSESQYVLHSEFAESYSDRNRDNIIYILTKKVLKEKAGERIAEEIKKGRSLDLYLEGFVLPKNKWENESTRVEIIKKFVTQIGKPIKELNQKDFYDYGIMALLNYSYKGSPYSAIKEAGMVDFEPWEMKVTPMGTFQSKKTRIRAVKWLVKKLNKNPREISQNDFYDNGLLGLIKFYHNGSSYSALKEAGLVDFERWEMNNAPKDTFKFKKDRIRAVHWLVKKLNKNLREITQEDFLNNDLSTLIGYYHNGSPYLALKEAGLAKFEPWEMKITPKNTFTNKKNRIKALNQFVNKLNKNPREITKEDFYKNDLGSLVYYCYNNSPYLALKEAGFVSKPGDMKHKPHIKE